MIRMIYCQTALGDEAVFLTESIFRIFDNDSSGTMDFQEYVLALHSTRSMSLLHNPMH